MKKERLIVAAILIGCFIFFIISAIIYLTPTTKTLDIPDNIKKMTVISENSYEMSEEEINKAVEELKKNKVYQAKHKFFPTHYSDISVIVELEDGSVRNWVYLDCFTIYDDYSGLQYLYEKASVYRVFSKYKT